ncbi:MAG: AAA family ATPase [Bacteroidia bacterium]|nr:AAA family ATPase [Bacteroidia bacterium]
MVKTIFSITRANEIPHKIYLLIDEYDHFANELLSFDIEGFRSNVSKNGFVRKFYESLNPIFHEMTGKNARPDVRGFFVVFLGGEVYQWGMWENH